MIKELSASLFETMTHIEFTVEIINLQNAAQKQENEGKEKETAGGREKILTYMNEWIKNNYFETKNQAIREEIKQNLISHFFFNYKKNQYIHTLPDYELISSEVNTESNHKIKISLNEKPPTARNKRKKSTNLSNYVRKLDKIQIISEEDGAANGGERKEGEVGNSIEIINFFSKMPPILLFEIERVKMNKNKIYKKIKKNKTLFPFPEEMRIKTTSDLENYLLMKKNIQNIRVKNQNLKKIIEKKENYFNGIKLNEILKQTILYLQEVDEKANEEQIECLQNEFIDNLTKIDDVKIEIEENENQIKKIKSTQFTKIENPLNFYEISMILICYKKKSKNNFFLFVKTEEEEKWWKYDNHILTIVPQTYVFNFSFGFRLNFSSPTERIDRNWEKIHFFSSANLLFYQNICFNGKMDNYEQMDRTSPVQFPPEFFTPSIHLVSSKTKLKIEKKNLKFQKLLENYTSLKFKENYQEISTEIFFNLFCKKTIYEYFLEYQKIPKNQFNLILDNKFNFLLSLGEFELFTFEYIVFLHSNLFNFDFTHSPVVFSFFPYLRESKYFTNASILPDFDCDFDFWIQKLTPRPYASSPPPSGPSPSSSSSLPDSLFYFNNSLNFYSTFSDILLSQFNSHWSFIRFFLSALFFARDKQYSLFFPPFPFLVFPSPFLHFPQSPLIYLFPPPLRFLIPLLSSLISK